MAKIKRIHVNQHNIKWNAKNPLEEPRPVISVKCGGKNYTGKHLEIKGESSVLYRPCKPLSCGAKVWIETFAVVQLDDIFIE